jgi:hypothetical protein
LRLHIPPSCHKQHGDPEPEIDLIDVRIHGGKYISFRGILELS